MKRMTKKITMMQKRVFYTHGKLPGGMFDDENQPTRGRITNRYETQNSTTGDMNSIAEYQQGREYELL